MEKYRILYNPLANNKRGDSGAHQLDEILKDKMLTYVDVTRISDMEAYLRDIPDDEGVIISGGDGTVNHFFNSLKGIDPEREILYYATGTGNDFLNDIERKVEDGPFPINEYIRDLPIVIINGKESYFFNGIGYGIDGYCCEEGDKVRAVSDKPVNYTAIALKGVFYDYDRTDATVIVDGEEHAYRKVWLAPTMNGRYIGGGMMITPGQDRLNTERSVTLMVAHDLSRLRILTIFPSIFKGGHLKYNKYVQFIEGHEITVRFNRPTALQIDGETVLNVSEYTVLSADARRRRSDAAKEAVTV